MSGREAPQEELVVLLDETGNAVGTHPKRDVHHRATPLHLAFSCYVFDSSDRLLVTRRALHKPTWPGSWTNSVCGHPGPGEPMTDAVRRRVAQEVGLELDTVRLALPAFRYRAVMDNGVVENEMCPVYVATTGGTPRPDPEEVVGVDWIDWTAFRDDVLEGRREISPWCRDQVSLLAADPVSAPEQPASALPPAAR